MEEIREEVCEGLKVVTLRLAYAERQSLMIGRGFDGWAERTDPVVCKDAHEAPVPNGVNSMPTRER